MIQCIILVKIKDYVLFADYLEGHLPTLAEFGGTVVFRSTNNTTLVGAGNWDIIAIQEWPSSTAFDQWWHSDAYKPWAEIRDVAADMTIIKCHNVVPE